MWWRHLLMLIFSVTALPALAIDEVGFPEYATCQSAIEAELANGAELQSKPVPSEPELRELYGAQQFKRLHNGTPATVIYLCNGTRATGGTVAMQLIYLYFQSEAAAREEFSRQRLLLDQQLGKPCWDPVDAKLEKVSPRTIWTVRDGIQTDVSWSKVVNKQPLHWIVLIGTHGLNSMRHASEPIRTAYASSSCQKSGGG